MLFGTYSVGGVVQESMCRTAKDYRLTEVGIYKIHATALMPEIPFDEANEFAKPIDHSIFINDKKETPLTFNSNIKCQNYLSTKYAGRAPLEWYNKGEFTKRGRKFILKCIDGKPNANNRIFGTEDALHGYNRGANDTSMLPGGGE